MVLHGQVQLHSIVAEQPTGTHEGLRVRLCSQQPPYPRLGQGTQIQCFRDNDKDNSAILSYLL